MITPPPIFKAASTVMVQGCTSDAGKSIIAAGLCRVLAQRGVAVAPFKPQNMALNSAVSREGGEIGRAQALQAIAAGLEPRNDFNPVLLKPASDTGAQVIIHGHVVDHMQAAVFHNYKTQAMEAVLTSYRRLENEFESIIVEGAGSPAEINLRQGDIANMGFAEAVDCPVILVADIDRGGVFAHIVGTLDLLSKTEQNRIIGIIINRFRGDIGLLQPGLDWLEKRIKKPVLGVLPYLENLHLDAEDAINNHQPTINQCRLSVTVPVLPRISNHTDFDALRLNPNIDLKFVPLDQSDILTDVIILPGSKNVIADLKALKKYDWGNKLQRHLRYGGKLIGICGGYQMLGTQIDDPAGVENNGSAISADGFGLLPISTQLKSGKQLKNVEGFLISKQLPQTKVEGYEIHCGISDGVDAQNALLQLSDKRYDGCVSDDNQVLGTYLHGLFDSACSANVLLSWCGMTDQTAINLSEHREQQLSRLADSIEKHINLDFMAKLCRSVA